MGSLRLLVSVVVGVLLGPALAFEGKPKLGPNATPITERTAYLRAAPAPDYWKLVLRTTDDFERLLGRQHDHGGKFHPWLAGGRR
jgi:hypothetical protein